MSVPVTVDFVDAVWFDPLTGDVYPAEVFNGYVDMRFRSGESRILRLYDHAVDRSKMQPARPKGDPQEIDLTGNGWTLSFIDSTPVVDKKWKLKKLEPWTDIDDPRLKDLMGTGVYTTEVKMTDDDLSRSWSIELGDVRESAKVYVNGKLVGTAWSVPFVLNLGDSLRKGKNTISIEVTNLPANRIAALDRQGVKWRKFNEINVVDLNYKKNTYDTWATVPSGLNSTVKLICH